MIIFKNVTKKYGHKTVVNDKSFQIKGGELNLFVGKNGSGKSTTIKLICRVIFLRASDQGIIINEAKQISYLPEKYLLPGLIKTVDFFNKLRLIYDSQVDIKQYMDKYNIPNKYIYSMSKGMLQKICLILVLLIPAELYVFDEPLDGLDQKSRLCFKKDVEQLIANNKGVIISTHNKQSYKSFNYQLIDFEGAKNA